MKIQDYLHLYIGCEVTTPDLITRKLIGVEGDAAITYGKYGRCVYSVKDTKPLLRPLSDMTEEEAKELNLTAWGGGITAMYAFSFWQVKELLSRNYDLFGLIDAGLAIPRLLNS